MSISSTKAPKTFVQTIMEIGYGALPEEATDELVKCMEACSEPGKKASLTLKIDFASKKNGQLIVSYDVAAKLPKKAREEQVMFQTAELHLTSRDPRQMEIEGVRGVPTSRADGAVLSVNVPQSDVKTVAGDSDSVRKVG